MRTLFGIGVRTTPKYKKINKKTMRLPPTYHLHVDEITKALAGLKIL